MKTNRTTEHRFLPALRKRDMMGIKSTMNLSMSWPKRTYLIEILLKKPYQVPDFKAQMEDTIPTYQELKTESRQESCSLSPLKLEMGSKSSSLFMKMTIPKKSRKNFVWSITLTKTYKTSFACTLRKASMKLSPECLRKISPSHLTWMRLLRMRMKCI